MCKFTEYELSIITKFPFKVKDDKKQISDYAARIEYDPPNAFQHLPVVIEIRPAGRQKITVSFYGQAYNFTGATMKHRPDALLMRKTLPYVLDDSVNPPAKLNDLPDEEYLTRRAEWYRWRFNNPSLRRLLEKITGTGKDLCSVTGVLDSMSTHEWFK